MAQRGGEKRSDIPSFHVTGGNLWLKQGWDWSVFHKCPLSTEDIGHDRIASRGTGDDRGVALSSCISPCAPLACRMPRATSWPGNAGLSHTKFSCAWTHTARTLVSAMVQGVFSTFEARGDGSLHSQGPTRAWTATPGLWRLRSGWVGCRKVAGAAIFRIRKSPRSPNSHGRREDIEAIARGLNNPSVITADMNVFDLERQFDRIVATTPTHDRVTERKLPVGQ
jgi:hypothetical protein